LQVFSNAIFRAVVQQLTRFQMTLAASSLRSCFFPRQIVTGSTVVAGVFSRLACWRHYAPDGGLTGALACCLILPTVGRSAGARASSGNRLRCSVIDLDRHCHRCWPAAVQHSWRRRTVPADRRR